MMSLTLQMLTFMPASTRPLRSQNAMNSRASTSPPEDRLVLAAGREVADVLHAQVVLVEIGHSSQAMSWPSIACAAARGWCSAHRQGDCARLLGEMPVTHREIT
jgi:hypothetical protein